MADYSVDFSPIAQLPQVYRQARQQAVRERTLADLASGNLDHNAAAQRLIASGDMQGGIALASLADKRAELALRERGVRLQEYAAMDKPSVTWQDGVPYRVGPGGSNITQLPIEGQTTQNEGVPPAIAALGQSAVKAWKENRVKQLSNIDDKAIGEYDKAVNAGVSVEGALRRMLELNKTAYAGVGAEQLGYWGSLLGAKRAEDTEELKNETTKQALEQLKIVFGGMPTEGERKILLDVQGSVNKSAEVRRRIFENALAEVARKTEFNKKTAEDMRSGVYLLPQSQRPQPNPAISANTGAAGGGYYTGGGDVAPGPGYYAPGAPQQAPAPQPAPPVARGVTKEKVEAAAKNPNAVIAEAREEIARTPQYRDAIIQQAKRLLAASGTQLPADL